MWISSVGNHGAAGGISERRRSSCSSYLWSAKLINLCFAQPWKFLEISFNPNQVTQGCAMLTMWQIELFLVLRCIYASAIRVITRSSQQYLTENLSESKWLFSTKHSWGDNSLHAKFLSKNINMSSQLLSFLYTDMTQVVGILPPVRQGLANFS